METTLKKMQENILPTTEKQENILQNILQSTQSEDIAVQGRQGNADISKIIKPTSRSLWRQRGAKIAIAGACCVALFGIGSIGLGQNAFAYLKNQIFGGYFANEEAIEKISVSGFQDEDKHVRFSMEELYSDGTSAIALIHYQALDQKGESFLASIDFNDLSDKTDNTLSDTVVELRPAGSAEKKIKINSFGLREIKSRTDGQNRYFVLEIHFIRVAGSENPEQWELAYCLSDYKARTGLIHMPDYEKEPVEYQLVLKGHEKYQDVQPVYLNISEIGASLWGEKLNFADAKSGEVGHAMKKVLRTVFPENLQIHMKDGKVLTMADESISDYQIKLGEKRDALLIGGFLTDAKTGDSLEKDWQDADNRHVFVVDPEEVDYLKLKGEKYQLRKVE